MSTIELYGCRGCGSAWSRCAARRAGVEIRVSRGEVPAAGGHDRGFKGDQPAGAGADAQACRRRRHDRGAAIIVMLDASYRAARILPPAGDPPRARAALDRVHRAATCIRRSASSIFRSDG